METANPRILLIYYSNSGDAERVAGAMVESLRAAAVGPVVVRLRPVKDYPYPWRSIAGFFGLLPECHFGPLPTLEPVGFDGNAKFDLVILVYQVWFLAPSSPIQSFMNSESARVLHDTKVITVSLSRNMWHSAAQTMKCLLKHAGARHLDHVSLTHQGPAWATFVTTPRSLLFGKKDGLWGIFPPAGLSNSELARVARFGRAIADQQDRLSEPDDGPLLRGLGAVHVNPRYVLAELVGWYCFRAWARLIHFLGRLGWLPRLAGVYLFVTCLIVMIVTVLPVTLLVRLLLYPLVTRWTAAYVQRLEEPSGP